MQEHRNGPAMWEIARMLWLENWTSFAVNFSINMRDFIISCYCNFSIGISPLDI